MDTVASEPAVSSVAISETMNQTPVPLHQWTHDGERVLLIKCVDADGKSHGGFQWPESGKVKPLKCSLTPDCVSGGLFGWAWGVSMGDGKEPDYQGKWIVFAARPEQVINLGGKQKVAAATPDEVDCEVLYYGDALGAIMFTHAGRMAFVKQNARWSASNSGNRGSASNSGYRGSASNSGYSGSASNSGYSGSASASGERGIACTTGEYSTLDVGPLALGAVTANRWIWCVRSGAVVACTWFDASKHRLDRLLTADMLGLKDGDVVKVCAGEIVKEWPNG